MASGIATASSLVELGAPASEPQTTFRRLAFDLAFTFLLLGALICGPLYLIPWLSGSSTQRPLPPILITTLLPIGKLLLLSVLERLLPPAGPRKSFGKWLLHMQVSIFYVFMAGFAGVLAMKSASLLAGSLGFSLGWIDLRILEDGKGIAMVLAAVWVAAIVGDFFFYWFHRMLHKTPFLWAHHKMHHMDRELEAVTGPRQNWIEVFIAALFITMPMVIIFKVDAVGLTTLGVLSGICATVLGTIIGLGHMNVRLQVGKASVLYCSPQVHRIHHSRLPEHQDKNFAAALPLWDVLFGTYYAPKRDEFPPTGVDGEREIESFWEAQIFTPREWRKMLRSWRQRRDTIST